MRQLGTCALCKGFLGISVRACPHCGAELGRARKVLAGVSMLASGSAVSATLMACYGGACVGENSCGDGYYGGDADTRTKADAQVGVDDGSTDGALDARGDARVDGGDGAADAPTDAPSDG